jgi:hypothetical protein
LQSLRPVRRVAELGSLGVMSNPEVSSNVSSAASQDWTRLILALVCIVPALTYFLGVALGLVIGGEAAPVIFFLRFFVGDTSLASFIVLVGGAAVSAICGLIAEGGQSVPRKCATRCGFVAVILLIIDVPSFVFQLHFFLVFRT